MNPELEELDSKYIKTDSIKDSEMGKVDLVKRKDIPGKVFIRRIIPFYVDAYEKLQKAKLNGFKGLPGIPELEEVYFYYDPKNGKEYIQNTTYVIEEYISGQTLNPDKLERPLTENEIIKVASNICAILVKLHGLGIIHCDLKPDNIFIDVKTLDVKLIDFGISRISRTDISTFSMDDFGTQGFAAPEQYDRKPCFQSDLYAVGKTIESLLPFDYNGKLDDVVNCCTKENLNERIKSASELKTVLDNLINQNQEKPFYKKPLGLGLSILMIFGVVWFFLPMIQQSATSATGYAVPISRPASSYASAVVKDVSKGWFFDDVTISIEVANESGEHLRTVIIEANLSGGRSLTTDIVVEDIRPYAKVKRSKIVKLNKGTFNEKAIMDMSNSEIASKLRLKVKQCTDSRNVTHY